MDYRTLLQSEFRKRKIVNARYSMRGFARYLDVDASTLSQILRGKRKAGKAFVRESGKRLGLNDGEVLSFLDASSRPSNTSFGIDEIRYRIMASWYHVALFELFALRDFRPEPRLIAKFLGIAVPEARLALERLGKVGLLRKNSAGEWERPSSFFSTVGFPLSSPAHRQVQGEFFSFALNAIESVDYEKREHSGLTIAARASDLPAIRKKIRKFQTGLNDWIERRGSADSVYQLVMGYFPLVHAESVKPSSLKGYRK